MKTIASDLLTVELERLRSLRKESAARLARAKDEVQGETDEQVRLTKLIDELSDAMVRLEKCKP